MGAVGLIPALPDLLVSIASGTHRLGFQCFLRIGGRHLAGHHPAQIGFQSQLIHQQQPFLPAVDLQRAPVRRTALAASDGLHRLSALLVHRHQTDALAHVQIFRQKRDLLPRRAEGLAFPGDHIHVRIRHDPDLAVIQPRVIGCLQRHPDGGQIRLCLHKAGAHLSVRHHEPGNIIAHHQRFFIPLPDPVIRLINMKIRRQRQQSIAFQFDLIVIHCQYRPVHRLLFQADVSHTFCLHGQICHLLKIIGKLQPGRKLHLSIPIQHRHAVFRRFLNIDVCHEKTARLPVGVICTCGNIRQSQGDICSMHHTISVLPIRSILSLNIHGRFALLCFCILCIR